MDFANYWFSSAAGGGGYEIGNSLRFRGGQYLSRTPSTAGNRRTWTWSAWVKHSDLTTNDTLFEASSSANNYTLFWFSSGNKISLLEDQGSGGVYYPETLALYRDPSAWYHVVVSVDTTQATSTNRIKLYINGVQQAISNSYPPQNNSTYINTTLQHRIGNRIFSSATFDGYMAEIHFVDGQALDSSTFGESNDNGVWVPREVAGVTYGTNGWYLDFSDPNNIGADRSGNGNNWTATNFELSNTSSTNYDWIEDSPTNNYATINPLFAQAGGNPAYFDGNLRQQSTQGRYDRSTMIIPPGSGKLYFELTNLVATQSQVGVTCGIEPVGATGPFPKSGFFNNTRRLIYTWNGPTTQVPDPPGNVLGANQTVQIAYDSDNGSLWVGVNNTWYIDANTTGGNPSAGTGATDTGIPTDTSVQVMGGSASTPGYSNGVILNYGQRPFRFTPPTGFEPLSTAQLSNVDITNPSENFQTVLGPGPGAGSSSPISIQWRTSNTADSPAATYQNLVYGKPATDLGATTGVHPAFTWASQLSLAGHDDWYIPAQNELEIIYRNLKPTTDSNNTSSGANANAVPSATSNYTSSVPAQTSVSAFQSGGSEAFAPATPEYWTASEKSGDTIRALVHNFSTGAQLVNTKSAVNYARAIRRVPYTGSEPAIGASYEGGYFGGLISTDGSGTADYALVVAPKEGGEYGVATDILSIAQRAVPNGLYWVKDRQNANQHQLVDSVRGGNLAIRTPSPTTETSYSAPSGNSVAWCWNAPESFTSSAGSIATSGRRNTTAGFSIISFSGNGTNGATIGHGLSQAPEFVIVFNRKQTNSTYSFAVAHPSLAANEYLTLNTSFAKSSGNNYWNSTRPGASVITLGPDATVNSSGQDMICYAWHSVPGYSSFGSYVGNGNADGPFIYTGFRVGWLLIKSTASQNWCIKDVARRAYNPNNNQLFANGTDLEDTYPHDIDFLSNGFKCRPPAFQDLINASGQQYIYIAFAEHPFGGANVSPSPAR